MKREIARMEIDDLDFYLQNHTDDYSAESHMAMMMAIDALKSSENLNNVLDKIRAEVKALPNANPSYSGYIDVVDREDVLEIIDKYKTESEDNE